jgi:hypothetical protein
MLTRWILFVSILLAALMLMPAGAHLLAFPNKIDMNAADYFVAQQVYRGWAYTGVLVLGGIAATASLAWRVRHSRAMFPPTFIALICLVATQIIFWTLVFPGNQQTQNWTTIPANWDSLRNRWEVGHALSAILNIGALVALLSALLRSDPWLPRNSGEIAALPF